MFSKGLFVTLEGVLHKRCNMCCEMKPFTPEYYHRDRSSSLGLYSVCKVCRNGRYLESGRKSSRAWKARNRERVRVYMRQYNKQRYQAQKLARFAQTMGE